MGAPGVVDQHIHLVAEGANPVGKTIDVGGLGDIQRMDMHFRSPRRLGQTGHFLQFIHPAGPQNQAGTFTRKRQCGGGAKSTGGAGDQYELVG